MNKTELDTDLNTFFNNQDELLAEIYFILKDGQETKLRLADLDGEAQKGLTKQFIDKVNEEIVNNDDLNILKISEADDRTNVIYEYDLEEMPEELKVIDQIIENEDLPTFSFTTDKLEHIKGIVILIEKDGNNLVIYKKHYPINLYKKDRGGISIRRLGNNQRFTALKEDVVKIHTNFEFFKFKNTLFINNLKTLEKFFGFHEVIKNKAASCINEIESSQILENPSELRDMLEDISFARKLTKAGSNSPVLGVIPNSSIISFVETFPTLKGRIEINVDKTKLKMTSKKSKQLFVKLLNDDFLQSELTRLYYDSLAKDAVEIS
jgi:Domain of unknown function (DUF4868)